MDLSGTIRPEKGKIGIHPRPLLSYAQNEGPTRRNYRNFRVAAPHFRDSRVSLSGSPPGAAPGGLALDTGQAPDPARDSRGSGSGSSRSTPINPDHHHQGERERITAGSCAGRSRPRYRPGPGPCQGFQGDAAKARKLAKIAPVFSTMAQNWHRKPDASTKHSINRTVTAQDIGLHILCPQLLPFVVRY